MCWLCNNNDGELQGCQDCGRLICFDVEAVDDTVRRAFVTSSGDLFCDLCGSRCERELEGIQEQEAAFLPDSFEDENI